MPAGPNIFSAQEKVSSTLQEAIARRAREIWEQRGRVDGHAEEDWKQAESEILRAKAAPALRRIIVKVGGITYAGEYNPASCAGYQPGDLQPGEPVVLRFDGDKMYVKCPNGTELETKMVMKARQ